MAVVVMPKIVTFNNFRGGEYGTRGPRNPPVGTFHGKNVVVFTDGSVGPRSGYTSGVSLNTAMGGQPSTQLWAVQRDPAAGAAYLVSQANGQAFSVDMGTNAVTVGTGGYIAAVNTPWIRYTNSSLARQVLAIASSIWAINASNAAAAQVAGTPGLQAFGVYGSRAVGIDNATPTNLRFSNPNDPSVWPTLNFIQVGMDYAPLKGMWCLRDRIIMCKEDGSWWVLTGTLGVNEVLRKVYQGPGASWERGLVSAAGELWFVPNEGSWPVQFTGVELNELRHLALFPDVNATSKLTLDVCHWTQLGGPGDIMLHGHSIGAAPGPEKLLIRKNGAWTYHEFPSAASIAGSPGIRIANIPGTGRCAVLTAMNMFGQMDLGLDRPGFFENSSGVATADYRDGGTDVDTLFELPQWWTDDGSEVVVRSVRVDFRLWDLAASTPPTCHFNLVVDAVGRHGSAGPTTSSVQSFDAASPTAAQAVVGGVPARTELFFGDQGYGQGFQLRFTGLRGVAIESVTVTVEQATG